MQRLEVIADTYLSLNAPVQLAAPVLLDQRKTIQPQLMNRVRANLAELDHQLTAQKSCSRLEVQGGWYAVLRIPAIAHSHPHHTDRNQLECAEQRWAYRHETALSLPQFNLWLGLFFQVEGVSLAKKP